MTRLEPQFEPDDDIIVVTAVDAGSVTAPARRVDQPLASILGAGRHGCVRRAVVVAIAGAIVPHAAIGSGGT